MTDLAAAILAAIEQRATDDGPRRPKTNNQNTPWKVPPVRAERRTRPTYRDPTADQAVGNLTKKEKR